MLDKETVNEAIKGLYAYLERQSQGGQAQQKKKKVKALFEEADDILLQVSLKKTPAESRTKPIAVPIKHSLYGAEGQKVCVFTKDPQAEFEELLLEDNKVDGVKEVISISKLRKEFREYKDRRDLLASYDLFLADDRVVPLLPNLLGNKFFHKKKQPVPVNLKSKNLKRELEKARDSTYMWISTGSTVAVKVARSNMTRSQVVANIMTAIEGVVAKIPRKWNNVQQVLVKTTSSASLPLYSSLPDEEVVEAPKAASKKRKAAAEAAPAAEEEEEESDEGQEQRAPAAKKAKKSSKKSSKAAAAAAAEPKKAAKKTKESKRKAAQSPAPAKKRSKKRAAA